MYVIRIGSETSKKLEIIKVHFLEKSGKMLRKKQILKGIIKDYFNDVDFKRKVDECTKVTNLKTEKDDVNFSVDAEMKVMLIKIKVMLGVTDKVATHCLVEKYYERLPL